MRELIVCDIKRRRRMRSTLHGDFQRGGEFARCHSRSEKTIISLGVTKPERVVGEESRLRESNPEPPLYKSGALPIELRRRGPNELIVDRLQLIGMVGVFALPTPLRLNHSRPVSSRYDFKDLELH